MPTLSIPIRNSNAYVGAAKQSAGGTAAAPSYFFWWEDGTKIDIDMKVEEVKEGDGSRHLSQIIKNAQSAKIHLVIMARPIHAGFLEEAAFGAGSDALTAPVVNTTTTAAITGGTTTAAALSSTTGVPGSGTIALVVDPGLSTEEIALFQCPVSSSNLSLASTYNGGKFVKSHLNGATIRSASTHTLTDQNDGDYFSFEIGLGSLYGGAGMTIRVRDCKVDQIKRSSKAGTYLVYELDLIGLTNLVQNSPSTVVMDTIHLPYLFVQGVWTLDGSLTGDALNVQDFAITQKNMVSAPQTESLNPAALVYGDMEIDLDYTVLYTNNNKAFLMYFGATNGTTDAQALYLGSLVLLFTQADGFHTLQYTIYTVGYVKFGIPEMKADGKEYTNQIQGTAVSNMGANTALMQTIIANTLNTQY